MGLLAKPLNRVLFLACVLVTGALAGAFVWAFFFCMDIGIEFAWHTLPEVLGAAVSGACWRGRLSCAWAAAWSSGCTKSTWVSRPKS